ncbi:SLIT and NTRK-like protein 4 [Ceratina calcarata]|uniref:SLIT and NTRK-like protein 4 n=1 Tax=Ceratina calcarata TaxID=156304 RepID=A0AAJ7NFB6_9HYME|nr:SLIT and NTRK-like protein 4 [Ceratina calcarata]
MSLYLFLTGLYFLCAIQASVCDICSTCLCTPNAVQINCNGKDLVNNDVLNSDLLTLNRQQRVHKLVLSNNNITTNFPRNLLTKLKYLRRLDLSENAIERVYTVMFIGLENLEDLNLSKNRLRIFDDSLLEVLPMLMHLNLSRNQMDSIEHMTNKRITRITELDLSHNSLSGLPEGFPNTLQNLRYLDLSFNRIHYLSSGNLMQFKSLDILYINNNLLTELKIQTLPNTLIQLHSGYNEIREMLLDIPQLEVLNIEYNNISKIENLKINSIHHLNIRGNALSNFPNILLENLRTLDISNNQLTSIPETISIKNLPLLEKLNISENPIKNLTISTELKLNSFIASHINTLESIDTDVFRNLRSPANDCINLTISNNKLLTLIDEHAFTTMNLCSLDLSNNHLVFVSQKLIDHNGIKKTNSINLQGNPFRCNCELQWMLNDLVPRLYSSQPELLDDLRCTWPSALSNVRMVHWYGWKEAIFCSNATHFNEDLVVKVASAVENETVKFDSSTGLLIVVGLATTVLTILIVGGIVWTQRIAMRRRRVNRKF